MNPDQILREQLIALLNFGNAHSGIDHIVAGFPEEHFNAIPPNMEYTPWHLLEHIRIAQWDILEFVRNPDHEPPPWPEGHWPQKDAKADAATWQKTIDTIKADLQEVQDIVTNPATDLYTDLPHAAGYNILREALLVADHNAFHFGEFAILRQVMLNWPVDRSKSSL